MENYNFGRFSLALFSAVLSIHLVLVSFRFIQYGLIILVHPEEISHGETVLSSLLSYSISYLIPTVESIIFGSISFLALYLTVWSHLESPNKVAISWGCIVGVYFFISGLMNYWGSFSMENPTYYDHTFLKGSLFLVLFMLLPPILIGLILGYLGRFY